MNINEELYSIEVSYGVGEYQSSVQLLRVLADKIELEHLGSRNKDFVPP